MRKKSILTLILLLATTLGYTQSKIDMTFDTPKQLQIEGKVIVNVYPSDEPRVEIKGTTTNEAINQISYKTKGDILTIARKLPISFKKVVLDSVVLDLYIQNPSHITVDDGAEVYFGEMFEMDEFYIEASSKSNVAVIVTSKKANIAANTSGKVLVSGKIDNITASSKSSGYLNTIQTECDSLNIVCNTNAEAYVRANQFLDMRASTGGNIFHKGVAAEIIKSVSNFGNIEKF